MDWRVLIITAIIVPIFVACAIVVVTYFDLKPGQFWKVEAKSTLKETMPSVISAVAFGLVFILIVRA